MKALFLPMAIVAALTLWYSNAQAYDGRGNHGRPHAQQMQNRHRSSFHRSSDHGRRDWGRNDHRRDGWDRGHDRGHGWGRDGAGRDFGHSQHGRRSHDDGYRPSNAGYQRGVDHRQWDQRQRLDQASHRGQLTRDERKSLWGEQRAIATEERQYLADGRFTAEERRDLHKDLSQASRHIYNESHDADRRQ